MLLTLKLPAGNTFFKNQAPRDEPFSGFFDKARQKIMQIDTPFSNFDLPTLAASSSSAAPETRSAEGGVSRRKSPRRFFDELQGMGNFIVVFFFSLLSFRTLAVYLFV